jgi:hypothetical protein
MTGELYDDETGARQFDGDPETARWDHPSNPEWRPCRQVYISDERRHELAELLEQFDRSHQ